MRGSRSQWFALIMVLVLLLGLLAGCGQPAAAPADAEADASLVDDVLKAGKLRVGLDFFVPWVAKDKEGNLIGFEVDVATKVAEDMGVEVEFVPTEWSGIIPALLTGKFDVIIGSMSITAERALKVNFTDPYSWSGIDLVVNKNMLPNVTSLEELNKSDVIVAVRLGATPAQAAAKYLPNAELHQFDTDEAVLQDVLNGNAHVGISSSPTPAFWAADYPDTLYRPLGGEMLMMQPAGFALRKGDADALAFFNAWIVANQEWLREREAYWFESKEWEPLLGE
ncbi:MAG: transporter substrate-binding domain-containing protein [Anaerolineae bacterium]|jgi:polar amino acid transport system substrate-binding protein